MREIHKYAPKSVTKTVYLNVFLGALIISQGFYSKTTIQHYLRTKKFRPPKLYFESKLNKVNAFLFKIECLI